LIAVPFIKASSAYVSFLVEGIDLRPGVLGWLIRRILADLEEVDDSDVVNLSLMEWIVGVYDETTKSEMQDPGRYAEPYIPAAWSGRNASGPVGHHHMRERFKGLGGTLS
jgi:hypothetical protein